MRFKNSSMWRTVSVSLLITIGCPSFIFSQDVRKTPIPTAADGIVSQQPPSQDQSKTIQSDVNQDRVGVDSNKKLSLSLEQAIAMALGKNRDIEIERANIQMAEQDLLSARGAYDPIVGVQSYYESTTIPTSSILQGNSNFTLTDKLFVYSPTLQQQLPTGGNYSLNFNNNRDVTTNTFVALNPSFNSTLNFNFTQPLLRNFKLDRNKRQILIAKRRLDLSDSQFKQRVIEIISSVQSAYWDLVFSIRDVEVKQEAVGLANEQLERNQRMVNAGTLAPVEIVSAEAEVKRREEDELSSVENITRAENSLKGMLLADRTAPEWESVVVPTEKWEPEPVTMNLGDALQTAMANRPELEQLKVQDELTGIDIKFYQNQTRPQLDLIGTYGVTGLAGTVSTVPNLLTDLTGSLFTRVNQLSTAQNLPPLPAFPTGVPTSLVGGQGRDLFNLFSNDFRTFKIGVNFNLNIHNRTAEGNLGHALAQRRQISAQRQKTEELVQIDVRDALQAVKTAEKRIEAARAAREASERQLQSEVRQYQAGESTNFLVLTRQNDLSDARGRELRAMTDYSKAIVQLQKAMATTLQNHNVVVSNAHPVN